MVLLGVKPERPETGYGWIVPRPGDAGRLRPVASFREKPDAATAAALLSQGGLLNSFILIADGRFLLDLFETALPQLWRCFSTVLDGRIERILDRAGPRPPLPLGPHLDFSKDLLERAADSLWVHPVPACGWLDLGTPDRLTGHLLAQGRQPLDGPNREMTRRPAPGTSITPRNRRSNRAAAGGRPHAVA